MVLKLEPVSDSDTEAGVGPESLPFFQVPSDVDADAAGPGTSL